MWDGGATRLDAEAYRQDSEVPANIKVAELREGKGKLVKRPGLMLKCAV